MSGLSEVGRVYGLEARISPVVTTFGFDLCINLLLRVCVCVGGRGTNCYLLLEFS